MSTCVCVCTGAFHVEMQRQPDSDRVILCRYHPTEIGEYQVYVMWSGLHVPGSPFRVRIVDTLQQLRDMNGGYLVPTPHDSKFGLTDDGLLFRDV
jgi:Filamin/ABP280 repeat